MEQKATQATVCKAADGLQAVGIRPTINLIIQQIGGSKSTVAPLLASWWETQATTPRALQEAAVADAERRLHDILLDLASSRISAEQRAASAEADLLTARAAENTAREAASQAYRERDAALAAAAGASAIALEFEELRRLVLADVADRRRVRGQLGRISRLHRRGRLLRS